MFSNLPQILPADRAFNPEILVSAPPFQGVRTFFYFFSRNKLPALFKGKALPPGPDGFRGYT
jgi:hypothetical protein